MSSYKSSISCLALVEALRVSMLSSPSGEKLMSDADYFSSDKESHGATSLFKHVTRGMVLVFFILLLFQRCYLWGLCLHATPWNVGIPWQPDILKIMEKRCNCNIKYVLCPTDFRVKLCIYEFQKLLRHFWSYRWVKLSINQRRFSFFSINSVLHCHIIIDL